MATTRTITNAYINQTLPDIFYEDPEPKEIDMLQRAANTTVSRWLASA